MCDALLPQLSAVCCLPESKVGEGLPSNPFPLTYPPDDASKNGTLTNRLQYLGPHRALRPTLLQVTALASSD